MTQRGQRNEGICWTYLLFSRVGKCRELWWDLDCSEEHDIALELYFAGGRDVTGLQKTFSGAGCLEMFGDSGQPHFDGLGMIGVEVDVLESVEP